MYSRHQGERTYFMCPSSFCINSSQTVHITFSQQSLNANHFNGQRYERCLGLGGTIHSNEKWLAMSLPEDSMEERSIYFIQKFLSQND